MNRNRLFLIGCPRSGTTLLQSMIASHPQVVSFPETHFFSETLPINTLLRRLKLYGNGSRGVVLSYLRENSYTNIHPFVDSPPLCTHNQWCKILLQTIDKMIDEETKNIDSQTVWGLEKTPRHLLYISSIQQTGFHNKFLHIFRNGPDVVASLYLATQKYPNQWGGARSVNKCLDWWNSSIKESLKYQGKQNHLFVTYEQLLEDPKKVLAVVCDYLAIDFNPSMTRDFHNTAATLTSEEEKWKQKNAQQALDKSNKLEENFDSRTVAHIKKSVLDIDLTQFHY